MKARHITHQAGYTLIELLLYVSIVGSLLTAVTYFFMSTIEARIKNQTIAEVNDQGAAVMDNIMQTVRNATSITTPATGVSGPSLTLAMPTAGVNPTIFNLSGAVFGYPTDGTNTDTGNSQEMSAAKYIAPATGTITTLYAHIGPVVAAAPNNKAQMAIYSGAASPSALIASSADTTIVPGTWNAFTIPAVSVTSGQTYWLAYNTNGLAVPDNNLRYHTGAAGQAIWKAQTYNIWPASWTGTVQAFEFSMFAMIDPPGTPGTLQIKEAAGSIIPLTNNEVRVSGLNIRNLTRTGTGGIVQVTFTIARVNPDKRNEYDYQKTFTSSAEVAW